MDSVCVWFRVSLVVCVCFSLSVPDSNTSCPTWFHYNNTSNQCECGVYKYVKCNQQEQKAEIFRRHCITSSDQEGLYYIGPCPFALTINRTSRVYSRLPSDPNELNDTMCGPFNRRGLLCGNCIDGFGPTVHQFDMTCANCSEMSTGLAFAWYLFIELVPSTFFFFV